MKRFIALAVLLPSPLLAQDQDKVEPSYDFWDVNYVGTSWGVPSAPDIDGNGYSTRFSVAIRDHLFFAGGYSSWELDGVAGGSTQTSIGIGSNWNVGRFSIYGVGGFRSLDLDLGAGNMEEEAAFGEAGLRWQMGRGFELRASVDYSDLTPVRSGETSVTVGADIYLTEVIALSIEANQNDDDTTTHTVGVRFYHKRDSSNMRQRR